VNKVDLMNRHFLDFNKDPFKLKSLFDDRMQLVSEYDVYALSIAVKKLAMEDVFPKPNRLVYECMLATPKAEAGTVACNICDGIGLVIGVVYMCDGVTMDIVSYDIEVKEKGNYATRVLGRCRCENGLAYQLVKGNVMGRAVDADSFLVSAAADKGWSASFEASQAALHFNNKQRELLQSNPEIGKKRPLAQTINNIIKETQYEG
jgi:hypothetical protein